MCKYRRVRNVFVKCGHAYTLPDQEIRCDQRNCIFSAWHPANCTGDACRQSCYQYHQYPEQYSPNINDFCPTCKASGAA